MILKRIAAISFAIAFIMALVLFTELGNDIIPRSVAKYLFLAAGAFGLLFNLLSFRHGKSDAGFNFFYWLGSLVAFTGLAFMLFHWPYGKYILIAGMLILGVSFFYTPNIDPQKPEDDLLDN